MMTIEACRLGGLVRRRAMLRPIALRREQVELMRTSGEGAAS
jgi:hypothetical protein